MAGLKMKLSQQKIRYLRFDPKPYIL